jgi:hypothetical protein
MAEFFPGLSSLRLPPLFRVTQEFGGAAIGDVERATQQAMASAQISGKSVAIAVGSRGVANLPLLVKSLADVLKSRGLDAFIVPAMGSHGNATADGQCDVLARLGVSEASCGIPIRCSMEAVNIGSVQTADGHTVQIFTDAIAQREADAIIPIARIKPHTGFRGRYESGICKMLAIGLGKHLGCSAIHREGYDRFPELIPAAAQLVLKTQKIAGAIGVIENAREETAQLEFVPASRIMDREPELLDQARALMPRILLPEIDVLVIEEIGKNISGVGMDSNVTGRFVNGPMPGFNGPKIARIVVLRLTPQTYGNAIGVGMADVITETLFNAIDRNAMYTNALTSGSLVSARIPIAVSGDEQAVMAAASCVPGVPAKDARIVWIKNTLHLREIAVSENLVQVVQKTSGCKLGGPFDGRWNND